MQLRNFPNSKNCKNSKHIPMITITGYVVEKVNSVEHCHYLKYERTTDFANSEITGPKTKSKYFCFISEYTKKHIGINYKLTLVYIKICKTKLMGRWFFYRNRKKSAMPHNTDTRAAFTTSFTNVTECYVDIYIDTIPYPRIILFYLPMFRVNW